MRDTRRRSAAAVARARTLAAATLPAGDAAAPGATAPLATLTACRTASAYGPVATCRTVVTYSRRHIDLQRVAAALCPA